MIDVNVVAKNALAKLPGYTGFLFTEIADDAPRSLYAMRDDERFAIGSSFKLFIFGTLANDVNGDQQSLDNVMRLESSLVGPPHSELASWPMGSPVTLQTLALKMISISDNTATDHLLSLLERRRVEEQMERMGHHRAEWNRPLLSTREMTMLRDKKTGLLGSNYQQLDEAGRRKFLKEHFSAPPNYDEIDFDTGAYNLAEWYATAQDMARALAWLKRNTSTGMSAHPLRAVLAVESKLPHDAEIWPYVGFKGGSEDQLLAGNWLLQNRNGRWYTLHVYWNNPDGKADKQQMMMAVNTIFQAIEQSFQ
jgi:beta-lactamase class A